MSLPRVEMLQRARALLRGGQLDAAEMLGRSLLDQRGKDGDALALMGAIASARTQFDIAADWYARAARAERRQPLHLCRLGDANFRRGRLGEALRAYEQALRMDPHLAAAIRGKANVLLRRGKSDRARAVLESLLKDRGSGDWPAAVAMYARTLNQLGEHEAVLAMRSHLDDPAIKGPARRVLLLALGASLDRLGRFDEAFDAFRHGKAIGALPFDPVPIERRFAGIERAFTSGAAMPRSSVDDDLPVFVLGMPRCGSTLVEQIIHAHPAAHGAGETHDLAHLARVLPQLHGLPSPVPACLADMTQQQLDEAARSFVDRFRSYAPGAARIVDKSLENHEHVGFIRHLLPAAPIVHVMRHPLDVCLSCFFSDFGPSIIPYSSRLEDVGAYYRLYERLMRLWRQVAGDAMLEIRYEQLVAQQQRVSRQLIEFVGLPWDDRCLRFHEAKRDVQTLSHDQVRRPLYDSAVARHRRYEGHLGPLRDALGDALAGWPD